MVIRHYEVAQILIVQISLDIELNKLLCNDGELSCGELVSGMGDRSGRGRYDLVVITLKTHYFIYLLLFAYFIDNMLIIQTN